MCSILLHTYKEFTNFSAIHKRAGIHTRLLARLLVRVNRYAKIRMKPNSPNRWIWFSALQQQRTGDMKHSIRSRNSCRGRERERMCCCAWLNSHQLVIFIHMFSLNQMGCNQWLNLKIADIICMCAMCVYLCVIIWQSGVQQSMNIVELFTRFLRFDFKRNSLLFVVLPSGND